MSEYTCYKKGPYDWLSLIPSHWNQLFLEQVASESCTLNKDNKISRVLSLSYGSIKVKGDLTKGLIAKDLSTYQIVRPNNIIMRLTDLQNDHKSLRTGLVKVKGIITAAYLCLVPKINPGYLHYLLHAYDTRKIFYGMGGGVRQSIGFKDIRHMYISVPPREEQDQIVRFLDWKVTAVNRLVEVYRKQIYRLEELKKRVVNDEILKVHNQCGQKQRLKTVVLCNKNTLSEATNREYAFKYVDIGSVDAKCGITYYEHVRFGESPSRARRIVHKGDIIISTVRTYLRAIAKITDDDHVIVSTGFAVLTPFGIDSNYLEYYLRSDLFCDEVIRLSEGIAYPAINTSSLLNIPISIPPKSSQIKFGLHVRKQCERIDNMIQNINGKIAELLELKRIIISDVVTGKVDVRNVIVPAYSAAESASNEVESDMGDM